MPAETRTKRGRTYMKPCPDCGSSNVEMIQLDSGHWMGTCRGCDEVESAIHWSKVAARQIWNALLPSRRSYRHYLGETPDAG